MEIGNNGFLSGREENTYILEKKNIYICVYNIPVIKRFGQFLNSYFLSHQFPLPESKGKGKIILTSSWPRKVGLYYFYTQALKLTFTFHTQHKVCSMGINQCLVYKEAGALNIQPAVWHAITADKYADLFVMFLLAYSQHTASRLSTLTWQAISIMSGVIVEREAMHPYKVEATY